MKFIEIQNSLINIEQVSCIRIYLLTEIQIFCADREYCFTFDTAEQAEAGFLRLKEALL